MKNLICLIVFLSPVLAKAQCAMCKAVVESGDKGMAQGVNNGIVYLMVFPYILVGLLAYTLYRFKYKK
jgi:hypothetical protein